MKRTERIGIYPGTFDPVTNGHIDIVKRSLKIVDKLVVAVAGLGKKPLFTIDERMAMIQAAISDNSFIEVVRLDGLLVDFARLRHATIIIRGLRAVSDFEYEFQMELMNKKLDPEIEIIFMDPEVEYTYISSSLVREVASLGGDVSDIVPENVHRLLKLKYPS